MQFMNTFFLLATTVCCVDAYKIRAFSGSGCTGSAREINVWDNTCRNTDVPDTRSIRVLGYGAGRQRAEFYRTKACALPAQKGWWADGGSNEFKKGACLDLPILAITYGSRSA